MKIKTIILTLSLLFIAPLGLIAQKQLMPGQSMYHPNHSADNQLERLFRSSMNNDPAFDIECNKPPKYKVYCVAPFNQCIGMFNSSGLRDYQYSSHFMEIMIIFNQKPNKVKLNGTVDITVDGGQNPLHVYFQDVIWQYEGNFGVWQTISESGHTFSGLTNGVKSRFTNGGKEYYIRLRFAPKNIKIGPFLHGGGGIPSGKYGFELSPRFTFIQLT